MQLLLFVSGLQGYQFEERISLKASRLEKDCLQHWVPLSPWRACFTIYLLFTRCYFILATFTFALCSV